MEIVSIISVGIAGLIFLAGLYKIVKSISFSKSESPYEYIIVKDEHGNTYEKVVDKTDKGERQWEWQSLS